MPRVTPSNMAIGTFKSSPSKSSSSSRPHQRLWNSRRRHRLRQRKRDLHLRQARAARNRYGRTMSTLYATAAAATTTAAGATKANTAGVSTACGVVPNLLQTDMDMADAAGLPIIALPAPSPPAPPSNAQDCAFPSPNANSDSNQADDPSSSSTVLAAYPWCFRCASHLCPCTRVLRPAAPMNTTGFIITHAEQANDDAGPVPASSPSPSPSPSPPSSPADEDMDMALTVDDTQLHSDATDDSDDHLASSATCASLDLWAQLSQI